MSFPTFEAYVVFPAWMVPGTAQPNKGSGVPLRELSDAPSDTLGERLNKGDRRQKALIDVAVGKGFYGFCSRKPKRNTVSCNLSGMQSKAVYGEHYQTVLISGARNPGALHRHGPGFQNITACANLASWLKAKQSDLFSGRQENISFRNVFLIVLQSCSSSHTSNHYSHSMVAGGLLVMS